MKPPREFGALPRVRYRPELQQCPHCGTPLVYSHPVWRKPLQSLTGIAHVTSLGYRCPQPACAFGHTVYRSARAEARQVKGSGYGLDVVVRIGHLRFAEHRTRAEIWRELDAHTPVAISERHVQNLLEVYLALLRASLRDVGAQVAATVAAHGGIILAVDGLATDQDDDQLWVVREVLSGAVLGAAPLPSVTAAALADLLRPVRAAGVPVLGVVSDAQAALRLAVADVFPGVPHQLCQWHALKEAAEPLWAADRRLVAEAAQALREVRAVETATRRADPAGADPAGAVVRDAALALRQAVGERGALPFAFAAPRVLDRLEAVGQTLDRCLAKGGTPGWPGCASWRGTPWRAAAPGRAN
jgi:transposase